MKHKKGDQLNIINEDGWKYYYGHITTLKECDDFDELEEDFTNPIFEHGFARMIPARDGDFNYYIFPTEEKRGYGIFPFTIIREGKKP